MRQCTTHHNACDCREETMREKIKWLESGNKILQEALEAALKEVESLKARVDELEQRVGCI